MRPYVALAMLSAAVSLCSAQGTPAALGTPDASSGTKHPMTFADMMKMQRLGETAVSADGQWLAYAVTTVNLDKNQKTTQLYIERLPANGEGQPEATAAIPVAVPVSVAQPGDSGLQFAPDNGQILFLSARDGGQQIWLADFDPATGETRAPRKLTMLGTEADNALWAPDGASIVFTSTVYPDCPAISSTDAAGETCNADRNKTHAADPVKARIFTRLLYRHWDHYTDAKRSHLFQLTLSNHAVRDLTQNDTHDVPPFSMSGGGGFAFAPDAKELAFTEDLSEQPAISTNADIFTLDLTDSSAKPVKVSAASGGDLTPAYSPDGRYLAWRSQTRAGYESDRFRLMLLDRRQKTAHELMPQFDRWVDEFAWASDSKHIYFVGGEHGEAPLRRVALDGTIVPLSLLKDGEFSDLHSLSNGTSLLAVKTKVTAPAEVVQFLIDTPERKSTTLLAMRPLTALNTRQLAELDLPAMEDFWFDAADKTRIQGFVIRPPAFDSTRKYPVKFLIHGGPQGAWGDAWSYRWNAGLFAANGYVVVMVNPRGSTGYGQPFVDGVNGDWGGKPFTDLMRGLDYAEQHYSFIDKSRECAMGASYGGFMANWILGHTNRFKCIVTHDGMYNPESAFGATEELWFNTWEFKGHPWDFIGKPDAENPFRKWSPARSAKNFRTPTLVIHNQLDYRLDVSEGLQLFTTLQLRNVPSKMLYFPDEGHWVLKPQNSQLWYKTVNDWVDQWTK